MVMTVPVPKYRYEDDLPKVIAGLRERIREAALQLRASVTSSVVTAVGAFTASGSFKRTPEVIPPDGAGEVLIDASLYHNVQIPLSVNATLSNIINSPGEGAELIITWIQDNAGGRTYSWPNTCKFAGAAPTTTTATSRTTVTFQYGGTYWWETSRAVGVV